MSSFKKLDNENETTSQSQRRPLVFNNNENATQNSSKVTDEEIEEKGTIEIKKQKNPGNVLSDNIDDSTFDSGENDNEELANMGDDILELSNFEKSRRRLTTDSGITSRGSSFSSEPDLGITDESIQEMKEYLHGQADALYKPFEHDKIKELKGSEFDIVEAKSEKLLSSSKIANKDQIMTLTTLKQEKMKSDRFNEIEASVMAGMYLFETGPTNKVTENRHGIPALELLVRKETIENISDIENDKLEKLDHVTEKLETGEKNITSNVEYQSAEIISDAEMIEKSEVEILNAVNIEKNNRKFHTSDKLEKIKTIRYVEEDDEIEGQSSAIRKNGSKFDQEESKIDNNKNDDENFVNANIGKEFHTNEGPQEKQNKNKDYYPNELNCIETNEREETNLSFPEQSSNEKSENFTGANLYSRNTMNAENLDSRFVEDLEVGTKEKKGNETNDSLVSANIQKGQGALSESNDSQNVEFNKGKEESLIKLENLNKNSKANIEQEESQNRSNQDKTKNKNLDPLKKELIDDSEVRYKNVCSDDKESIMSKEQIIDLENTNVANRDFESGKDHATDLSERCSIEPDAKIKVKADILKGEDKSHLPGEEITSDSPEVKSGEIKQAMVEFPTNETKLKTCKDDIENEKMQEMSLSKLYKDEVEIIESELKEETISNIKEFSEKSETEIKKQKIGMKQKNGGFEHYTAQEKLANVKLYSAEEESDRGIHFTELLEDADLVHIDDTKPEVPNIVNVQRSWKEKEIKTKDASLTEEIENKVMTLNDMSNDPSLSTANESKAMNGLIIASAEQIHIAPEEDECLIVESKQTSKVNENNVKMSKNEAVKLSDVSAIKPEIDDNISNQNNKPEIKDISLNEMNEDIIIPESVNKESETAAKKTIDKLKENIADLQIEPTIKVLLADKDVKVMEGSAAKIQWEIQGIELSKVDIFKNGQKLKTSNNVFIDSSNEVINLLVDKVFIDDEGTYSVRIQGLETDHGEVNLTVIAITSAEEKKSKTEIKPEMTVEILQVDSDVTVTDGSAGKLQWKITGIELSMVDIYKNGRKVKESGNVHVDISGNIITLKVDKVSADDEAAYTVREQSSNKDHGDVNLRVINDATADVKESKYGMEPDISVETLLEDKHVNVNEGNPAKLQWRIKGTDMSKAGIYKNGQKVNSNSNMHVDISDEVITLLVDKVSVDDEASYTVRIKGSKTDYGEVDLTVTTVASAEEKPSDSEIKPDISVEVLQNDKNVEFTEDSPVKLQWKIKGIALSKVDIYKDGQKVKKSDNIHIDVFDEVITLQVDKVSLDDEATYTVRVQDSEKDFGDVNLIVLKEVSAEDTKSDSEVKPEVAVEVLNKNTNVNVLEGSPAKLQWKIDGIDLSKLDIYMDGQRINTNSNVHVNISDRIITLQVDKVSVGDEAAYTIRVHGSKEDHGEVCLTVNSVTNAEEKDSKIVTKPRITVEVLREDTNVQVSEGDPAKLQWKIKGIELSKVDIYKNGRKVKTNDNVHVDVLDEVITLLIDKVSIKDESTYTFRAQVSDKDYGEVDLTVVTDTCSAINKQPKFSADAKLEPVIEVLLDDANVKVTEGSAAELKWKIQGIELSKVDIIYKNGKKVTPSGNVYVDISDDVATLLVDKVSLDDQAAYTVRLQGSDKDYGEVDLTVVSDVKHQSKKNKPQQSAQAELGHSIEVLEDDTNVQVNDGSAAKLQWKIQGVELSKADIFKNRQKVGTSDNIHVDVLDEVLTLSVDKVTVDDEAIYTVRIQGSEIDHGEVRLNVVSESDVTSVEKESTVPCEPAFVVEPVIDIQDGRRLSIKCAVTGFPAPEVTWYHQGQQLNQDALWEIFNQDGYYHLGVEDPSLLDCQEIVCRLENDLGYVQRVVRVKIDGDEIYCEPVLPPVSPETHLVKEFAPHIEIDFSETVTANLRKLPLAKNYTDSLNFVTLNAGDVVEVLACHPEGSVLARNMPQKDKVCYIPQEVLRVIDDVSTKICEREAIKDNSQHSEQDLQQNIEEAKMPERRKMKSPSPKMTSTPKMKRKEVDTESSEELQKRLGYGDNPTQKKEFSTKDSVEFTEYNDGTTRPMFKKRLKSVTGKTGEMAQLECTVSGSPLPKILWLKNNRPLKACDGCKVIVDEGTNILVFPQAKEEDVGIYTARAMNVNGSIMCSAEFSLSDGQGVPAQQATDSPMDMDFTTPAYFFQMSSCEVAEGRLARFDCRVVAYPKPEIVWMRDGKVVETEQRYKLLNFNNEIYSLLIQDVRIEDTGRYTCWARNKFGEAMTEAYLNVIALTEQEPDTDIAPKFLTRFYDQQTTEGTATDFRCLIAGRPEPSVTWLLDDLEIHEKGDVKMRHKDGVVSLEIKSPKVEQSGTYTCQLSNPLGEATCSAKLTVVEDKLHGKMLPKFLKKFDHLTAKEGEEAKFTSVIVGEPQPDVTWLFDHKPISDTNRRFQMKKEGDAYTLIIKNLRFDDAGKITCKASNEEGEVYCSANLNVRESKFMRDLPEKTGVKGQDETDSKFGYIPTFTKRLQDLEVKEGAKATFECKVMGIPDPEIAWMKDGRVISPGGRYHMTLENGTGQLVIDNVTASDTGVYTCIVSNAQGKSSSTAALKLEEPKKDRYTPDRLLEERVSRKDRYTPDKYLLDDSTTAKRPYLDTDRYDKYDKYDKFDKYDAKAKRSYESPLASTKLDDTYSPRSKKKYESPKSSYDTFKPKYESSFESPNMSFESSRMSYDSPKRSYESPLRQYDSSFGRLESPIRQYDSYKRYESPVRQYDGISTKYESPVRPYESISTRYESPVRQYDGLPTKYESPVRPYESISSRYESPVRMHDTPRSIYESPRRKSSIGREEKIKAVPKIPFDRPALLNKHEDSVQLSWLPAPTYDLPDDARHISYVIESREMPGREWTKIASAVHGTSYTARNLRPDKEYEFRVRAQNQYGASEPTWNALLDKRVDGASKQLDLPEMRAPPRLPTHRPIITDLGEETLRLAWRPAETLQSKRTPPVSYRLEAKELPGKDWMPLSSRLRDTSHYLSELPHDRDFMIRVRAENDFGMSEPTEPLWLPRATAFPGVPITRPEIIDYEDTRAKLSWTRVDIPAFSMSDSPLTYMLEVEEPPHKDWRTIARDLDDTEYIVEGLRPGQDYRFRVRAKTPTGIVSEPSPAVSLYTKLAQSRAPVDRLEVLEYEPDSRSVHLSWDRVNIPPYNLDEEPLMYMLEYQEPPLPEWKTLVTGIPTTRYRVMHLDSERDYNFRVRALTPFGVSPPSPALPVSMRPAQVPRYMPEKVIISEVEPHSLRLTWRRPMYDLDKSISYQVEMLEPPFSDWKPIATRVMDTTYKVIGLKPTRDYQFRVIPQVDSGYLTPSPSAALTTMPVRPRLPYTEPRLKELTPESVQLSWGSAELPAYQRKHSPIYYKVEMAELPSSNWVPVARRVPETTYNVTGLRPNLEYKFRVFAESDSGFSEPTMPVTLFRKPAPKFTLKEPSIRDISQNIVHLTWTPAEFPDSTESVSYMVEMQTPPGISTWSTLYRKHPSPSVRLADLRPDLDYLVRVRAQCGSYLSEPTLPVYIPRRAAPPRLPVEEPYAVDISNDSVKLQWRSAELPTHIQDYAPVTYRLEAQEFPDTNWVTISRGIPHTDFKVTGLNPQKDYNFRIRAENEYGLSDPTHPMTIRKRSVAPVLPTSEPLLYDVGPGSARLSWRPATLPSFAPSQSPITYTLFVQELPFKTWRPLVKRIPHTSYYVSGLQPDKEYMFRVQAENQFGSSKPTDSVLLQRFKDFKRPISVPEVSDFDEDLTSVKLRWSPTRLSPPFDTSPRKYTVETWEPVRREWKPVARGIPDTTYQIRKLPKLPDHLFRVRMETEEPSLSEPSLPVSLSRYRLPRAPMYRPQLYEVDDESVRLSWQPVHVPEGVSRRSVRYTIEQREIPEPHWSPVASDIIETSYKVRGLRVKHDYEFRVKATYDGTSTEPSYPVSLFRRAVIPTVKFEAPEVYDVDDTSLSLRWNTVDVPAFTPDEEPLLFVIERQILPSYEWQPVATNIQDKTYTVRDLQPYQDYNFRVRGIYPSGYTEPSPYVPVYRRPSESKIGLVGLESSTLEYKSYGSQKYSSILTTPQKFLPSQKLHATVPATELSAVTKKAIETRLRSYGSSPQRRYSVANIYDTKEIYSKEAEFKPSAPIPETRFKLENAYVYKRSRSPVKVELPTQYDTLKAGESKKVTPKKEYDLYEWYRQLHRRYSDVGIEELTRRKSRKSQYMLEKVLEQRRAELILEAQNRKHAKRASVPTIPPHVPRPTETWLGYASVADRYEDIKCPYIVSPGHWRFARRHSVALDWDDLLRLQRQLKLESNRLETKRRSKSEKPKWYNPQYDFISQTQDEYFGGTYFHIEDQLNFNDMRPRIPQSFTTPYIRRSLSQERDPGYFMISKFALSISGVKKDKPEGRATRSSVRPVSLEPSPVARLPRQYRSYTPDYKSYIPDYRSYRPEYRSLRSENRSYTSEYRSYTPEYRSYTPEYRSYSADQRSLPKTRSMTPDFYYYDYSSRSQSPEFSDMDKIKQRSQSLAQELARSKLYGSGYRPESRSASEKPDRQTSPAKPIRKPSPPRQKEAFVKPRSYSISVPRAEVKKFNRIIEDSKTIITNYTRLDEKARAASVAKVNERTGSVADIRSDPHYSSTPRGSMSVQHPDITSDPRYSSMPRGSMSSQHSDVRSDPRYTSTPRGSVSAPHVDPRYSRTRKSSVVMSQSDRERLSSISAIQSDARFSAQRRATIATNEDLKSKLDTLTSTLSVPKPKKRKSSRPVIKFKSSRGEGAL